MRLALVPSWADVPSPDIDVLEDSEGCTLC